MKLPLHGTSKKKNDTKFIARKVQAQIKLVDIFLEMFSRKVHKVPALTNTHNQVDRVERKIMQFKIQETRYLFYRGLGSHLNLCLYRGGGE